jgi:serine/threonine-protein kinase
MDDQLPSSSDDTVSRTPAQLTPDEDATLSPSEAAAKGALVTNAEGSSKAGERLLEGEGDLEQAKTVIRGAGGSGRSDPDRVGRTPAEIAQVLVGKQLNQYRLDRLIGGGGMGAVFRAHDEQLDRVVALKVIPFVGNDPELQRRFRNEAQNAAKLDHPRIARVFDAGSHQDWHYIVFEYINGTNLRDLVEGHGVLSLDEAVFYTSQVAEALEHASLRGIVHRDIKPSNLLVGDDGTVKLVDMGLARSDNLDLSEDMTASGVTLGTFDYISPEQALDPRDADLRSDLYSLGCTFYFMLTGKAPYTGGTMLQKLLSHGNAPLPDPRVHRKDLPDEVVSVMHRMMAKDPKSRYQNANDLLADLNELAYRFQLKRSQSNAAVLMPTANEGLQRLQMHLPWMITVLLVLMIGGYLELQANATRESFVIEKSPTRLRVSGGTADARSTRPGAATANVVGANAIAGSRSSTSSGDRTPRQTLDPDGVTSGEENSRGGEQTDSNTTAPILNDSGGNPEMRMGDASKPPSIGTDLPFPEDYDDREGVETPNAMSMSDREANSESASNDASVPANSGAAFDSEQGSQTAVDAISQGEETSAATESASADLPPPQSVRVVSQSLLALATRVDQVDRDVDGSVLAGSLADAVDLAMRFGVSRIELAVPELVSGPVDLPQDNMYFVSTVGRTTIRMASPDPMTIGRSEMINVGNNRAQFEGLDFHWELSPEQIDGAAMFLINDNRSVRFQDCTFTLINRARQKDVCFFQVITDPRALPDSETLPGRIFNPNENALPLVAIQLKNAIVRGEADMIRMDYATELQLDWDNGLLAISGRMIDSRGALRRPSIVTSPIQLSFSNLTALIPDGLLRMRIDGEGRFLLPIDREATECVFQVDEGQPHVEIDGAREEDAQRNVLKLRGEANRYDVTPTLTDPMLLVSDQEGNVTVNAMADLTSDTLSWSQERSPRWTVYWSKPPSPSKPFHELRPADFRQDGIVSAGFDEVALPRLD